jgi:putative peptide zinc metalloprotease protein
MPGLADSTVSSSSRPLPVRLRPDVSVEEQRYGGRTWWVFKEPVGMNYFRFREEDYFVLTLLDGRHSLDEIQAAFRRRFAPEKIGVAELQSFIGQAFQSGLLLTDQPGQGAELLQRRNEKKARELKAAVSNLLAVRFKGVDPEGFLNWLHPRLKWIYTRWFTVVYFALALSALLLVTVQFDAFRSRLPAFHEFFQAKNAVWMAVALAFSKVLHELGHGLTCKHYGGECHEMGVMLLVLTPCLYCNVSDSWMLPNKWHRAAIGAAGMYVELFLASVATFVWWVTEPGMLNYLSLSTMFVCSTSTVLVNGNPLMRYDGYFILSDLLEVPNLAQKSRSVFVAVLSKYCLGLDTSHQERMLPEKGRGWFFAYTVASTIYRWVVLVGILWFLNQVFKPYNLEVLGRVITLVVLWGLVAVPAWQMWKFFRVPGRIAQVKPRRLALSVALAGLAAALVALVPVPHHVYTAVVIEARDADRVYVTHPGRLAWRAELEPGATVQDGQVLTVLSNPDLELELAELAGQVESARLHLRNLNRQRRADPAAAADIPSAEKALDDLEERFAQRRQDRDRLTLRVPPAKDLRTPDGSRPERRVLPPPAVPPAPSEGRLPAWSGNVLDESADGAWLERETLFCLIGDPRRLDAVLVIDQGDVEFVDRRGGQEVEIQLDALPGRIFRGRISQVAQGELKLAPRELSAKVGGELQTRTDKSGAERPESTSYQARVPLDDLEGGLLLAYRGRSKIHVPSRTLGQILWRYLSQTIRFRL